MSFWGKIRRRLRMRAQIGPKTTPYHGILKIPAQWVKMSRKNDTANSNFRSRCFGVVFGPIRAQIRDLRLVSLHKHIVKGVRRPRDRSLRPGHRCVRACSMSVIAWQQHVGDHGDLIFPAYVGATNSWWVASVAVLPPSSVLVPMQFRAFAPTIVPPFHLNLST